MKYIIAIALLFLMSGCNVIKSKFKRYDKQDTTYSQTNRQTDRDWSRMDSTFSFERFLNDSTFERVRIVPIGDFTYEATKGFSGQAKSIDIERTARSTRSESGTGSKLEEKAEEKETFEEQTSSSSKISEIREKEKKTKPNFWVILGFTALGIITVLTVLKFISEKFKLPF